MKLDSLLSRKFGALAVWALAGFSACAANWPEWRGPEGTGVAHEAHLPEHWSKSENVLWHAPLPGPGNSTPIVWENRIFLTQSVENRPLLLCFDRSSGKLLWQSGPEKTLVDPTHERNPRNASSPVTDGQRVIAWFGSAGLFCYDFSGKEIWSRDLGVQRHIWGYGASPIIHGNVCYLNFGPGARSFLIALDKKSGKTIWQVDDAGGDPGEGEKPNWVGSWSTPIIINPGNREELVLSWPNRVASYDPSSGKEYWTCSGLNPLVYTSPLYDSEKGIVVAMGGFSGSALAVKTGGSGDVTQSHRVWQHLKTRQRIGSGVLSNGYVYILNDPGVAECFEVGTGKRIWEERLKGPGPTSDNWSSMILAGDKIYAVNQGGDAFVLKASPHFEVLATNSIPETTIASMAASNDELFIRTYENLWRIGSKDRKP